MLTGKVCLVTGAGGGIGRATAVVMAQRGAAAVILSDLGDRASAAVEDVKAHGAQALSQACDVSDAASVAALMSAIDERFGRLDVLHNNAGLLDTQLADQTRVDTLPESVWDAIFNVNVKGVWLCTKYAAPLLRKSPAGAIVNGASISGFLAFPEEPAYCASKAAVIQLTRNTAMDLAPDGVRCNCYCPASVDTPMLDPYWSSGGERAALEEDLTRSHLVPRLGRPQDIAKLVCFLASDDASFINGAAYPIDGGVLAWRGLRESAATTAS